MRTSSAKFQSDLPILFTSDMLKYARINPVYLAQMYELKKKRQKHLGSVRCWEFFCE